MKTLLLLRHAKSKLDREGEPDHDRALKKRGKRDARHVGWLLLEEDIVPQLIISSTAKRARTTAKHVALACGYEDDIVLEHSLYEAGPMGYIRMLQDIDDRYQRVMVVGHNPGLELLLEVLTGASAWLPPGALARLDLPIRLWQGVQEYIGGRLINIWVPKQLKHLSKPVPLDVEFPGEPPAARSDVDALVVTPDLMPMGELREFDTDRWSVHPSSPGC